MELTTLLDIAQDKSKAGRVALIEAVSELYFDNTQPFSDRETALVTIILDQLIGDVDKSIRQGLAERLADHRDAPRDMIVRLANDDIEVAHSILVRSLALQDHELIDIIQQRTTRHRIAIAMRATLSPEVSGALMETDEESVIVTLLENMNAQISVDALSTVVDRSRTVSSYQELLLARHDLSSDLATRMYWWVAASLRQRILQRYEIEKSDLDEAIERTVNELIADYHKERSKKKSTSNKLIEQLSEVKAITPALLVGVLRAGEIQVFESMFGMLTDLKGTALRQVLYQPPGNDLAVACKAVGIRTEDFTAMFLLSRQGRPGDKEVNPDELNTVLSFFTGLDPTSAGEQLDEWRRSPNYRKAIRDLKNFPQGNA